MNSLTTPKRKANSDARILLAVVAASGTRMVGPATAIELTMMTASQSAPVIRAVKSGEGWLEVAIAISGWG